MAKRSSDRATGWSLYWLVSEDEDCFVVARNSRSAQKVECDMNGFGYESVEAHRAISLTNGVVEKYEALRGQEPKRWPGYADDDLLHAIGAEQRVVQQRHETRIGDYVYSAGFPPYSIGNTFLREFRADPRIPGFGDEDRFGPAEEALYILLGVCLARVHEIERLITRSFVLGRPDMKEGRELTVQQLVEKWERKTLGQLLSIIKRNYEIHPAVLEAIEAFVEMRNNLAHGLTTHPKYDIETSWGRDELVAFLVGFETMSRLVRRSFRGSFVFSLMAANRLSPADKRMEFTEAEKEDAALFAELFEPRSSWASWSGA